MPELVSLSGTESAGRVADVLLLLASGPPCLGVTEIARELDLSKAVVHRILRSLASRQLVRADGGAYGLGVAAAAMGARALRDLDLRTVALPVLRRLQAQTNETTTVWRLTDDPMAYSPTTDTALPSGHFRGCRSAARSNASSRHPLLRERE